MDTNSFLPERTENEVFVKDELDSDGSSNHDSTLEVTENRLIFSEPNTKCGEVLLGHRGIFTIVCALCAKCFNTLEEFGTHVQDTHLTLKELLATEEIFIENVQDASSDNEVYIKQEPTDGNAALDSISSNGIIVHESEINETQDPLLEREALVCKLCSWVCTDHKSYLSHAKQVHGILTSRMRNKLRRQVRKRTRNIVDLKANAEVPQKRAESEVNKFPCTLCESSYSHKRSLDAHIRKKHADSILNEIQNTSECDEPKENDEDVKDASESEHSQTEKEKTFPCPLCDHGYSHRRSLLAHLRKKHANSSLNQIQSISEGDEPNENRRHEKKVKAFSCPLCKHSYSHRRSLLAHLRKKHGKQSLDEFPGVPPPSAEPKQGIKEQCRCHICKRLFNRRNTLNFHIKRFHGTNSLKSFLNVCRYCDKTFDDYEVLRAHVTDDHPGDRKFLCPYCPKVFKCNTTRKGHINTHTGERPYKCPHCSWAFSNSSNLNMHIKAHLHIKKHPCSMCGKLFISGCEKRRHERTHTGEKHHQCEECGKRYDTLSKLREHHLRHKNIRNHECKVCAKRFYTSRMLRDHMASHSQERPFSCSVCGQSFPRYRALKVHEQLHSEVKKYICPTCGKAFAQFAGLYSHRKSHNGFIN